MQENLQDYAIKNLDELSLIIPKLSKVDKKKLLIHFIKEDDLDRVKLIIERESDTFIGISALCLSA